MTNTFTRPTLTPAISNRAVGGMTCVVLIGDGP